MPVRKVSTASKAIVVQVIWSKKRGRVEMEHIGSAHSQAEVELLLAVAGQVPIKRNRFVTLTCDTKTVNHDLEVKARVLIG